MHDTWFSYLKKPKNDEYFNILLFNSENFNEELDTLKEFVYKKSSEEKNNFKSILYFSPYGSVGEKKEKLENNYSTYIEKTYKNAFKKLQKINIGNNIYKNNETKSEKGKNYNSDQHPNIYRNDTNITDFQIKGNLDVNTEINLSISNESVIMEQNNSSTSSFLEEIFYEKENRETNTQNVKKNVDQEKININEYNNNQFKNIKTQRNIQLNSVFTGKCCINDIKTTNKKEYLNNSDKDEAQTIKKESKNENEYNDFDKQINTNLKGENISGKNNVGMKNKYDKEEKNMNILFVINELDRKIRDDNLKKTVLMSNKIQKNDDVTTIEKNTADNTIDNIENKEFFKEEKSSNLLDWSEIRNIEHHENSKKQKNPCNTPKYNTLETFNLNLQSKKSKKKICSLCSESNKKISNNMENVSILNENNLLDHKLNYPKNENVCISFPFGHNLDKYDSYDAFNSTNQNKLIMTKSRECDKPCRATINQSGSNYLSCNPLINNNYFDSNCMNFKYDEDKEETPLYKKTSGLYEKSIKSNGENKAIIYTEEVNICDNQNSCQFNKIDETQNENIEFVNNNDYQQINDEVVFKTKYPQNYTFQSENNSLFIDNKNSNHKLIDNLSNKKTYRIDFNGIQKPSVCYRCVLSDLNISMILWEDQNCATIPNVHEREDKIVLNNNSEYFNQEKTNIYAENYKKRSYFGDSSFNKRDLKCNPDFGKNNFDKFQNEFKNFNIENIDGLMLYNGLKQTENTIYNGYIVDLSLRDKIRKEPKIFSESIVKEFSKEKNEHLSKYSSDKEHNLYYKKIYILIGFNNPKICHYISHNKNKVLNNNQNIDILYNNLCKGGQQNNKYSNPLIKLSNKIKVMEEHNPSDGVKIPKSGYCTIFSNTFYPDNVNLKSKLNLDGVLDEIFKTSNQNAYSQEKSEFGRNCVKEDFRKKYAYTAANSSKLFLESIKHSRNIEEIEKVNHANNRKDICTQNFSKNYNLKNFKKPINYCEEIINKEAIYIKNNLDFTLSNQSNDQNIYQRNAFVSYEKDNLNMNNIDDKTRENHLKSKYLENTKKEFDNKFLKCISKTRNDGTKYRNDSFQINSLYDKQNVIQEHYYNNDVYSEPQSDIQPTKINFIGKNYNESNYTKKKTVKNTNNLSLEQDINVFSNIKATKCQYSTEIDDIFKMKESTKINGTNINKNKYTQDDDESIYHDKKFYKNRTCEKVISKDNIAYSTKTKKDVYEFNPFLKENSNILNLKQHNIHDDFAKNIIYSEISEKESSFNSAQFFPKTSLNSSKNLPNDFDDDIANRSDNLQMKKTCKFSKAILSDNITQKEHNIFSNNFSKEDIDSGNSLDCHCCPCCVRKINKKGGCINSNISATNDFSKNTKTELCHEILKSQIEQKSSFSYNNVYSDAKTCRIEDKIPLSKLSYFDNTIKNKDINNNDLINYYKSVLPIMDVNESIGKMAIDQIDITFENKSDTKTHFKANEECIFYKNHRSQSFPSIVYKSFGENKKYEFRYNYDVDNFSDSIDKNNCEIIQKIEFSNFCRNVEKNIDTINKYLIDCNNSVLTQEINRKIFENNASMTIDTIKKHMQQVPDKYTIKNSKNSMNCDQLSYLNLDRSTNFDVCMNAHEKNKFYENKHDDLEISKHLEMNEFISEHLYSTDDKPEEKPTITAIQRGIPMSIFIGKIASKLTEEQLQSYIFNPKNNTYIKRVRKIDYKINLQNIIDLKDLRTTCMIKNIPNKYTQKMLLDLIDESHIGTYDFVYLRMDFKNKCNVGYAFINFRHPFFVYSFFKKINGKMWLKFNSNKIAVLSYASIQGFDSLVNRFKRSEVNKESEEFRPLIIYPNEKF
ncbi:hypothetical protein EDEG_00509 [Edhazardia aedis USNM 41457]|uniref:RRM domain-containing protein n=1 Tax=Edhazardia aedis (strain USNM 41457) TaxID=1003232 RepID=J9DIU0_EDHAE|nr:hypothetical protein EDEG_00509 [Edhazardia aedis USNM 41457]|eukprot:EJW01292.1 hypothetical protein EDEG_00509 [Edhazardia aedis USNM 41457]